MPLCASLPREELRISTTGLAGMDRYHWFHMIRGADEAIEFDRRRSVQVPFESRGDNRIDMTAHRN
jgi:hypothetical protein